MKKYSEIYNIDQSLIFAIIKAESDFDGLALSSKGAIGLMQIMPITAKFMDKSIENGDIVAYLQDAENNIKIGCQYLYYLKVKYDNDEIKMISAYNAGEGNVDKWIKKNNDKNVDFYSKFGIEDIVYEETKDYVTKVLKYKNTYEKLYNL